MDAIALVMGEADWSPWTALSEAAQAAPQQPGVYLARGGLDGPLLYVGHAGERAKSSPGLRGRLGVYARGRGAVSGLGEAALDRALADPAFVRQQLDLLEAGAPQRAKDWARAALAWADVHVCWTARDTKAEAVALEARLLTLLGEHDLWNRARPGSTGTRETRFWLAQAGVREDVEAARTEDARDQTTPGGELRAELGLGE